MPLPSHRSSNFLCIFPLISITCISLLMECTGEMVAPRLPQQKSDVRDIIIALQCSAKCEEQLSSDSMGSNYFIKENEILNCEEKCRTATQKLPRPGMCPNVRNAIFQNISPRLNELSCVDSCSYDFDCPEVQKCCPSTCGNKFVCMKPFGLHDLPPVPKIVRHKLPRGHKVEITIAIDIKCSCFYHLEIRSHIGLLFSRRKLGPWHLPYEKITKISELLDGHMKRIDFAFDIKPGHWYQVRVAAINSNGFSGYSEPSKAFSLANRPKPPKAPADVKVVSAMIDDGFLNLKIVWCPSKSNLPVEKYKIVWSLYVKSKGDSFISNESFVRNAHSFVITKLLPDSSYYIQVQAMTAIGKRRLKSEKQSILYNTTSIAKGKIVMQPYEPLNCSNGHNDRISPSNRRKANADHPKKFNNESTTEKINPLTQNLTQHYEAHYLMNRKLGLIVRISGFHPLQEKVYELCPKKTNCEEREYSAIRAKKNALEFSKLKYNTTYMLTTFQTHEEKNKNNDANMPFIFTTPKCEQFSKKYQKMQIKC